MNYRRSPNQVAAERTWQHFVERNARIIADAGLPPVATVALPSGMTSLMHGYLAGDPGGFVVEQLSGAQYESLVELAANYFAAGYEFYRPIALRSHDQAALRARFDTRR